MSKHRMKWTEDELDKFKKIYGDYTNAELSSIFGRTPVSIEKKAGSLGLRKSPSTISRGKRKWLDEDIIFLKENYGKLKAQEIADHLGVSLNLIYTMSDYYGLSKKTNIKRKKTISRLWTDEEVQYLISNYSNQTHAHIADALGRSVNSINQKSHSLGLRKYKKNDNWSQDEIDYLREHYYSGRMIKIMSKLNQRTFKAIHTKANELNLKRDTSTYIEVEIREALEDLKIDYSEQVRIDRFIGDFVVYQNIVLEINGDYWHCNPKIYNKPKDDTQRRKIKQDEIKKSKLESIGYKVLYIWEYDINNNFDEVLKFLRELPSSGESR